MTFETMERMFGYGQQRARLWAIGIEEYSSIADLDHRAQLQGHAGAFVSLRQFHEELLGEVPKSVTVWDTALNLYEKVYGCKTVLGELDPSTSDLLLAEILPLPKPGVTQWPALYQQPAFWPQALWSDAGGALTAPGPWHAGKAGRDAYEKYAMPRRADWIAKQVSISRPQVVLIHGVYGHDRWVFSYIAKRELWEKVELDPVPGHPSGFPAYFWRKGPTLFVRTYNLGRGVFHGGFKANQRVDRLADAIRLRMSPQAARLARADGATAPVGAEC